MKKLQNFLYFFAKRRIESEFFKHWKDVKDNFKIDINMQENDNLRPSDQHKNSHWWEFEISN